MKNRGEVLLKILDFIGDSAVEMYDVIEGTLAAGYGSSFGKLKHEYKKRSDKRFYQKIKRAQNTSCTQNIDNKMMYFFWISFKQYWTNNFFI